tara:strand:- start:70 stop:327 length:258 start_codon:yes stop_codon:yes gene_type:complete
VAVVEDAVILLQADQVAVVNQFIVKQELPVILPQQVLLKEMLEDQEQVPRLQEITEAVVAEAMAVREEMVHPEMMEHQEQVQLIQ